MCTPFSLKTVDSTSRIVGQLHCCKGVAQKGPFAQLFAIGIMYKAVVQTWSFAHQLARRVLFIM